MGILQVCMNWAVFTVLFGVLTSFNGEVQAVEPIRGMISLGTWGTKAEFKDIVVTKGNETLFTSDFSHNREGWKVIRGTWDVIDGALRQTSDEEGTRIIIGDPAWSDYTLSVKARKLSGREGFLIGFALASESTRSWWNLGGWGKSRHAIESPGIPDEGSPGRIETDRWYDIRIELKGNSVRAFLDNQLIADVKQTPPQRDFGRSLIPDLIADPSIVEIDGTFYCNATTDGAGAGLSTSGVPVVWKSKDFLNWSFSGSIFPANYTAKYWAPSGVIQKDGRYFLFPTLNNKITAVVADSPEGPYRALDGKDIADGTGWKPFPIRVGNPIDAEVFIDDDGSAYMVWSQRGIGKLKPDFSDFEGEQKLITTKRGGYSEGPYLFKRNGIYYYLYTLEGHENYKYAYMMSRRSPFGPWEAPQQDIIAQTNHEKGVYGPGHGCFLQHDQQWYFVYLEYGRAGTNRQVYADKMNFNDDGTIQPIQITGQGVGAIAAAGQETNLALGKQATASSVLPDYRVPPNTDRRLNRVEGYSPDQAIDGSNGSRWMAREDDGTPWYQLDLGDAKDITRTELYFVKPTVGHAYRLEYSLDGTTWQPYTDQADIAVQSPHSDARAVRARYLKLTILRGTPGLWEFRVY